MFTIKVYEKNCDEYVAYSCISYRIKWRAKRFGLDITLSQSTDFKEKAHTISIRPPFQVRSMIYVENLAGKTIDRFEVVGQHLVPTPTEK